ncbi:hypothetical protein HDC30_002393 [Pseudomonas sp. JAI115]|uniref:hypothetical protein n=1 Tax=Pseudomonas sp. JAI115 TaxID=2723061 RepID=UPI001614D6D1|nr:hypothetical protein [Pseudomonas sp. JAI115]MBB6155170.1 hypothetical protein [Pseudomonas sp. JAI115]
MYNNLTRHKRLANCFSAAIALSSASRSHGFQADRQPQAVVGDHSALNSAFIIDRHQ